MPDLEILRVPNFEYSGMYFPDISARLRRYARIYAPEITNEDRRELAIQLERSFALMAHYNNVLLDMLANEMYLETARLPESVKLILALINYRLLPASPARVDMLATLARTYTTPTQLLDTNRKFTTKRNVDEPEIIFENTSVLDTTSRTEQLSDAFTLAKSANGTCSTSSTSSNIITNAVGSYWYTADINKYIQLSDSVLGNNTEDLRIIELLDETTPGSGWFNQVRLENGSFITESSLTYTMRANTANNAAALNAGTGVAIFATAPVANDKFYFGHSDVMFDRFDSVLSSGNPNIKAVWEFFDDSDTTYLPDDVTIDISGFPGTLQFDLSSFLGVQDRSGTLVQVHHIPTGAITNAFSSWYNGNVVRIDGYLGQITPSTTIGDYLVSSDWRPLDVTVDTTQTTGVPWESSGYTKYNLPQSQSDNWSKYTFYDKPGALSRIAYFIRYRVVENSGVVAGPIPTSMSIVNGEQYILQELIQGKTVEDDSLGSSNGDQTQKFTLLNSPYIYQSVRVYVDEGGGDIEWTEVDTFLTSYSISRHFMIDVQTDGTAVLVFGDGINGRIPPIGTNNIRALYRIGADEDGNIGANTLTVNRDGAGVFKAITNPRAGEFWIEADWNSQDALERVKLDGPMALRTMSRAMAPRDVEILARAFINTDGVRPVARSRAYEEAFGPKTVELVVAGGGGAALTTALKASLAEFFNGGDTYGGVLVTNHQVVVSNYIPRLIGYTIEVTAQAVVTEALVLQALSSLLSPTALEDDRVTYVWEFGQEVPNSRINSEIFKISPGNVTKVVISSPSIDIGLEQRELPMLDVANTHIVIIEPVSNG